MNPFTDAMRLALTVALATSADARACGERLAGKTIAVETMGQRLLIGFSADGVEVRTGEDEADVTVRGSPTAVLGSLAREGAHTAAVLGEADVFDDFRHAFRPHLHFPSSPLSPVSPLSAKHLAEDASDAARIGAQAAKSAFEGLSGALRDAVRDYFPDRAGDDQALATRLAELAERVDQLERRLTDLEGEGRS